MNKSELVEALVLAAVPDRKEDVLRRLIESQRPLVPNITPPEFRPRHFPVYQEVLPMVTQSATTSQLTDGTLPFDHPINRENWYKIERPETDGLYGNLLCKEELRNLPGKRKPLSDRERDRRRKHRKEAKASRRKNR